MNRKYFMILIIVVLCIIGYLNYATGQINLITEDLSEKTQQLEKTKDELLIVQENLQIEIDKSVELNEEIKNIKTELGAAQVTIETLKNDEYELTYIGGFKITYYCDERYQHICGGNGVTKSGKSTEVGVTAAADWAVLPKGSKVYIEGIGFREIQDVGGGVDGHHIDVLVKSHDEAISLGTSIKGVWILTKKNS